VAALRRAVAAADDGVAAIETAFLIAVHATIFVLVVAGVVLRYGFNDPLTWSEEVIVGLFTWMVFIGAAAAVRSHMHIRIDVMAPLYASPRLRWLNALTVLAGVAIIVVMVYACTLQVLQEASVVTPMLNVSRAWFIASMPVGLLFMLLHVLRLWLDKGPAAVFKGETESAIEGASP
jgi:TRAP-type C4-dicarboxylate transport system permease small subunit